MERIATCQCRAFQVVVTGDPAFVNICHCTDCQRRSGAPLTSNAYFKDLNVRLQGEYKVYSRPAASGDRQLHNRFCPTCGATVCWKADLRPDHYGIAIGAFNDPSFPTPTVSLWETRKYDWVTLPAELEHFAQGRPVSK
jgi:hypothetical protein